MYYFTKNTRYYALEYRRDLFDIVVLQHYGRIGTRLGQSRTHVFNNEDEAKHFLSAEINRRFKRGYTTSDSVML